MAPMIPPAIAPALVPEVLAVAPLASPPSVDPEDVPPEGPAGLIEVTVMIRVAELVATDVAVVVTVDTTS